jgi:hypothetical protein
LTVLSKSQNPAALASPTTSGEQSSIHCSRQIEISGGTLSALEREDANSNQLEVGYVQIDRPETNPQWVCLIARTSKSLIIIIAVVGLFCAGLSVGRRWFAEDEANKIFAGEPTSRVISQQTQSIHGNEDALATLPLMLLLRETA